MSMTRRSFGTNALGMMGLLFGVRQAAAVAPATFQLSGQLTFRGRVCDVRHRAAQPPWHNLGDNCFHLTIEASNPDSTLSVRMVAAAYGEMGRDFFRLCEAGRLQLGSDVRVGGALVGGNQDIKIPHIRLKQLNIFRS
jgi:hypothetical protein